MVDVFISHVQEDSETATQFANALEAAGYSTWYYERDTVPGPSYLLQVGAAIERSRAILLMISPHALGSHQMTKEVVRGHESGKQFIPVLLEVSHLQFQSRQPEWRAAIGAAASVPLVDRRVSSVIARVLNGLSGLGIKPSALSGGAAAARNIRVAGVVGPQITLLSTQAHRQSGGTRFRIRVEGENWGSNTARWGGLTVNLPGITTPAAAKEANLSVSTSRTTAAIVREPHDTIHGFRTDGSYGEIAATCLLVETGEGNWQPGERLWIDVSILVFDGKLEADVRAWATWEAQDGSLTTDGDPAWARQLARDQQGIPAHRVTMSLVP